MEDSPVVERAPAVMEETTVMEKELEPSGMEGSPILEGEGSPIVEESPNLEWSLVPEKEPVEERASPSIETPYYRIETPPIAEQASRVIEKTPVMEEPTVATEPTVVEKPFVVEMTPVEKRTYFMEAAPPVAEKPPVVEKTFSPGKAHDTEETPIVIKKPVVENKASAKIKVPVVKKTQVMGKASATKETPFVNKVHVPTIMQKVPVLLETTVSKMAPLVEKFRKEIRTLQNYQEAPPAAEPAATMSVLCLFALYITLFTLISRLNASSVLLFLPRL